MMVTMMMMMTMMTMMAYGIISILICYAAPYYIFRRTLARLYGAVHNI